MRRAIDQERSITLAILPAATVAPSSLAITPADSRARSRVIRRIQQFRSSRASFSAEIVRPSNVLASPRLTRRAALSG